MTGNRSLDEFGSGEAVEGTDDAVGDSGEDHGATVDGTASESAGGGTTTAEEEGSSRPDVTDPGEATSTYEWRPDGIACPRCGETVTVRWHDGEDLVCEACKVW